MLCTSNFSPTALPSLPFGRHSLPYLSMAAIASISQDPPIYTTIYISLMRNWKDLSRCEREGRMDGSMCVESGVGAWKRVDVGRRAVANGDMLPAAEAWPRAGGGKAAVQYFSGLYPSYWFQTH